VSLDKRKTSEIYSFFYLHILPLFREDDPFQGFAVRVGTMGMRMFSSAYWKCAETGCADPATKLKFVFAESLVDINSGNYRKCMVVHIDLFIIFILY